MTDLGHLDVVRFSDFLVNEIDASGRVVRLTSIDAAASVVQQPSSQPKLPAIPKSAKSAEVEDAEPQESVATTVQAPDAGSGGIVVVSSKPDWAETVRGFADVLPAASYTAVLSFYETIAAFEAARSGTSAPQILQ